MSARVLGVGYIQRSEAIRCYITHRKLKICTTLVSCASTHAKIIVKQKIIFLQSRAYWYSQVEFEDCECYLCIDAVAIVVLAVI